MPDFSVAVQDAVYEQLNVAAVNDVAGVEGDVRGFQHVPEDTQPPLWIIGDISVEPAGGKDGGLDRLTVEIASMVREPKRAALYALMAAIRGQLEDQELPAQPGAELSRPVFESSDDQLLEDGETYLGIQRFSLFAQFGIANAEAEALIARMEVEPDDERKLAIDTLVGDLKVAGLWSTAKLPLLYVTWAHSEQAALLNWTQDLHNATNDSTPSATFTANEGFASQALNTGASLSSIGASSTSLHLGVFTSSNTSASGTDAGGASGTVAVRASSSPATRGLSAALHDIAPAGSAPHHIVAVRRDASEQIGFRNGGNKTTTVTPNAALGGGAATFGSTSNNRKTGVFHAGPALTDGEVLALYNALEAYRLAL